MVKQLRIHDQTGTPLVFEDAATFVRAGRRFTCTQPNGDPAADAMFRRGIHPRERTWGSFLHSVVTRERTRGRLSCLLLGNRLVVTFHTEVTRTQCTFTVAESSK